MRTVLTRLNERGESTLQERREIIKRVVEFEDFSSCWDEDKLPAKGLVAQVRKVVNVKAAFTRINQEREAERKKAAAASEARARKKQDKQKALTEAKRNFFHLFAEEDAHKRGRLLEPAISQLFKVAGIRVREPFHVVDPEGGGIVEQVDGIL